MSVSAPRAAEAELQAYWDDFVRRPVKGGPPGRQFVQRPADPHPFWVTNDTDAEGAEQLSLCVYLGNKSFENAVEVPAVAVRVPIPDLLADEPLEFLSLVDERREELGLPAAHYSLIAPEHEEVWLLWRIRPLHRPSKSSSPKCHIAWRKMRLAWQMAQLKLALAFGELGAVPHPAIYEPMIPLPHPAARAGWLGLGSTYIADAAPSQATYVVQDVSEPLDGLYDKAAFAQLQPHHARTHHWAAKGAWLESDAFTRANQPQPHGYRHPAALTQACIMRWAGFTRAEILDHLRRWLATCPDVSGFMDRELQQLAEWADAVLVPGGPRRAARGKYERRREVVSALCLYLASQDADTSPHVATQAELCRQATLHSGVVVSKSTLQKLLPELEAEGYLQRTVTVAGRASTTSWALLKLPEPIAAANDDQEPARRPWRPPEIPPSEQMSLPEMPPALERPEPMERQTGMGLGAPGWGKPEDTTGALNTSSEPPLQSQKTIPQERALQPSPSKTAEPGWPSTAAPGLVHPEPPKSAEQLRPAETAEPRLAALPSDDAQPELVPAADVREDLAELHPLGWSLIVLKPHSKRPVRERWRPAQLVAAPLDTLQAMLERYPGANLAVVTGEVSSLVVVDLDDQVAVDWARAELPTTRLRVRTSRGEHWYYRLEGPQPSFNPGDAFDDEGLGLINVKGDGGYVVAPYSHHPDGGVYEPSEPLAPELLETVPLFQRSWFAAEDTAEVDHLAQKSAESDRDFGARLLRELNRALRSGAMKRVRDIAAQLKDRNDEP